MPAHEREVLIPVLLYATAQQISIIQLFFRFSCHCIFETILGMACPPTQN